MAIRQIWTTSSTERRVRKEWREKSASMWPTIVADNQHDILYFDGCSVLYSVQHIMGPCMPKYHTLNMVLVVIISVDVVR